MSTNIFTQKLSNTLDILVEEKKIKNNISANKQAKEMGIPQQTFNKYLNNVVEAPISAIAKMSEYYNVSTDYLLGITTERSKNIKIKGIHKVTGLESKSIKYLNSLLKTPYEKENWLDIEIRNKNILKTINLLLSISDYDWQFFNRHILENMAKAIFQCDDAVALLYRDIEGEEAFCNDNEENIEVNPFKDKEIFPINLFTVYMQLFTDDLRIVKESVREKEMTEQNKIRKDVERLKTKKAAIGNK